jgi:hypothetical protein
MKGVAGGVQRWYWDTKRALRIHRALDDQFNIFT